MPDGTLYPLHFIVPSCFFLSSFFPHNLFDLMQLVFMDGHIPICDGQSNSYCERTIHRRVLPDHKLVDLIYIIESLCTKSYIHECVFYGASSCLVAKILCNFDGRVHQNSVQYYFST